MTKLKALFSFSAPVVLLTAALMLTGCGGLSEAQLAELDALRQEVRSLENEANSLKDQRSKLERDIAEKNAKLEQCAKDKAEAQSNLEKLPK